MEAAGSGVVMNTKPTYEELEKLNDALSQEIATCRNLQRFLHQAEETARALLNATTDSAILIDNQVKIEAINEIAAKRLSKNNVCLVHKNLLDILPPDLARQRKVRIDQVLDTGDPLQFEDDYAGTVFLNSLYPVFDRQGSHRNISASIGVSELREKEKLPEFIRRTDSNLYAAKAAGKNQVIFI